MIVTIKVDNAAEIEKYPERSFPTETLPVDSDVETLRNLKFPGLPVRMRRMHVIYAAASEII